MKTKIGKKLLKNISKEMTELREMISERAKQLNSDKINEGNLDYIRKVVISDVRHLREMLDRKQKEINDLILMESFLE